MRPPDVDRSEIDPATLSRCVKALDSAKPPDGYSSRKWWDWDTESVVRVVLAAAADEEQGR